MLTKTEKSEHPLNSFYQTAEPGFKILEMPSNVVCLPVNVKRVTYFVVDQDDDTVNFREEVITARLHWDIILGSRLMHPNLNALIILGVGLLMHPNVIVHVVGTSAF